MYGFYYHSNAMFGKEFIIYLRIYWKLISMPISFDKMLFG